MNVEKAYKIPNYYLCVCYLMMESHWNCMPSVIKLLRRVKWQMEERKKKYIISSVAFNETAIERNCLNAQRHTWHQYEMIQMDFTNELLTPQNEFITRQLPIENELWLNAHYDIQSIFQKTFQIFCFHLNKYLCEYHSNSAYIYNDNIGVNVGCSSWTFHIFLPFSNDTQISHL